MSFYASQRAMNRYEQMGVQAQVSDASPHQLVQMMLDGAVARVAAARGALDAGEKPAKSELIGKAIGLIEGLRVSVDAERGGELASNLQALYEYMGRRLLEANARDDAAILEEIASLLRELQGGWREMGEAMAARGGAGTGASASAAV